MNFSSTCVANHFDDLARRGAAHQRVINNDNTLTLNHSTNRIEFKLDTEVANRLLRLNKGSTDVMIANQPQLEGDARFFGITHCRRYTGVRHGKHDISVDMVFTGQLATELFTDGVNLFTKDRAVRTCKVDKFEDTGGWRGFFKGPVRRHAVLINNHHLARIDFTDKLRLDQVKGTSLRGDNISTVESAESKRTETVRVTNCDHARFGEKDDAVGALNRH